MSNKRITGGDRLGNRLLLTNGNFITLDSDSKDSDIQWLYIEDKKIKALGNSQECPQCDTVIDLKGKTVLPGFVDSHVHSSLTGLYLNSVNLSEAECIQDVLDLIEERCASSNEGLIFGMDLSPDNLKEERMPTRWDLDKVTGDKMVFVHHKSLHGSCCNTKAWDYLQVPRHMPGIEKIDGEITGVLVDDIPYEFACLKILELLDEESWTINLIKLSNYALENGVTTIHALTGSAEPKSHKGLKALLESSHKLPVHYVPYFEDFDVLKAKKLGLPRVGGCLCLDGSRMVHTLALNEPYTDRPELRGQLYFTDEEVYNFVSTAHKENMQCAMHASGERAIEQLITTINRVVKEQGDKKLRHRIEHFSLPTQKHIEMAAELGVVLSMQPAFPYYWDQPGSSIYAKYFGRRRANLFEPFAEIIDQGGIICGGSDSPVTEINPLLGIHSCVNSPNPMRRISVENALKIFTVNGAWAANEEQSRGVLKEDMMADLVVLDRNPMKEPESIIDFNIEMTIAEGQIKYKAEE